MKNNLTMKKQDHLFYSFPKEHIQDYVYHGQSDLDLDILEDLKNFFQGHLIYPYLSDVNVYYFWIMRMWV